MDYDVLRENIRDSILSTLAVTVLVALITWMVIKRPFNNQAGTRVVMSSQMFEPGMFIKQAAEPVKNPTPEPTWSTQATPVSGQSSNSTESARNQTRISETGELGELEIAGIAVPKEPMASLGGDFSSELASPNQSHTAGQTESQSEPVREIFPELVYLLDAFPIDSAESESIFKREVNHVSDRLSAERLSEFEQIQKYWQMYRIQFDQFASAYQLDGREPLYSAITNGRSRDLILLHLYVEDPRSLTIESIDDARGMQRSIDAEVLEAYDALLAMGNNDTRQRIQSFREHWEFYRNLDAEFVRQFGNNAAEQELLLYRQYVSLGSQHLQQLRALKERIPSMDLDQELDISEVKAPTSSEEIETPSESVANPEEGSLAEASTVPEPQVDPIPVSLAVAKPPVGAPKEEVILEKSSSIPDKKEVTETKAAKNPEPTIELAEQKPEPSPEPEKPPVWYEPESLPDNFDAADRLLNTSYKTLRGYLDREQSLELTNVQRTWIKYKEQSKSYAEDFSPAFVNKMRLTITNGRTKNLVQLQQYISYVGTLLGQDLEETRLQADQLEGQVKKVYDKVQTMGTYGTRNRIRDAHNSWKAYRDLDLSFARNFGSTEDLRLLVFYREKIAHSSQQLALLKELQEQLATMPPPPSKPLDYLNTLPIRISKAAREHIIKFETGGRLYFEQMYQRPQWPGYASGVTIGMGYDLGYHTKEQIRKDWAGVASSDEIYAMTQVQGVTGSSAKYRAWAIGSQVHINWHEAGKVFDDVTIPRWSRDTAVGYRISRGELHPDCMGALIGNTFNRGVGFAPTGKKREKYLIREALRKGNYAAIPWLLREQRKHWPGSGGTNGLQTRRSDEADLFQAGLDAMESGWPPESYAADDKPAGDRRTYDRNDVVGEAHPIWTNGELHQRIVERKDRILGSSRSGEHYRKVRAGVLYAASASAHKAESMGYHIYVTSGNRWKVSSSPNHAQNGLLGDSIDFIVTTEPWGGGSRLPATSKGMQETYDILAAAIAAGANGIGWGRGNNAGHHVEVDDYQRGSPGYEDVWAYDDGSQAKFLQLEKDFAYGRIWKDSKFYEYQGYYHGKIK